MQRSSARATFGRLCNLLLVGTIFATRASAADIRRLFVANSGDDTVSVIDVDTDRELDTLAVAGMPHAVAVRVADPLVAVVARQQSTVRLFDPVRLAAVGDPIHVGRGPEDVEFVAGGRLLATTSYFDRTVTLLDVSSRTPVGVPFSFPEPPVRLLASEDGSQLFILVAAKEGFVAILDVLQGRITARAPVGPFPTDLALSHDGTRLLVASFNASSVTALRLPSGEPAATFSIDTGFGLVCHPRRPIFYSMLSFEGEVAVFDYEKGQEVTRVAVGPGPTHSAITPDGATLYVVNNDANNVVKLDTATNATVLRISVGADPIDAALFWSNPAPSRIPAIAAVAVTALILASGWGWARRRRGRAGVGGKRPPTPASQTPQGCSLRERCPG